MKGTHAKLAPIASLRDWIQKLNSMVVEIDEVIIGALLSTETSHLLLKNIPHKFMRHQGDKYKFKLWLTGYATANQRKHCSEYLITLVVKTYTHGFEFKR
jgi:hypothetical protein